MFPLIIGCTQGIHTLLATVHQSASMLDDVGHLTMFSIFPSRPTDGQLADTMCLTDSWKNPIFNQWGRDQSLYWTNNAVYHWFCKNVWDARDVTWWFLHTNSMASHKVNMWHYSDAIMSTMVSQITGNSMVYSTISSGAEQRKHQSSALIGLCAGNSPVTGEIPAQTASNAENVSIWWCDHACKNTINMMHSKVHSGCHKRYNTLYIAGWKTLMKCNNTSEVPTDSDGSKLKIFKDLFRTKFLQ